eukprot:4792741-Prymnesium_polylepis.1
MYFIAQGECAVIINHTTKVATIGRGAYFGEVALLFSTKRTATIRTTTYCKVLSLAKVQLVAALKGHTDETESIKKESRRRLQELLRFSEVQGPEAES